VGFLDFNDQGSVTAGPGSVLNVIGGPGEFAAGADISGGGEMRFDQGAAMTLASPVQVGAGSAISLAGNARFSGPGSFTGGGKFSWSGGTISGNLDVASGITTTISGTATKNLTSPTSTHALLAFHGSTTVKDPGPLETFGANIANSGTFTVKPGATVEANSCCTSPDQFLNTGTISLPAAKSGKATVGFMDFSDQGSVSAGRGSVLDVIGGPGEFGAGAGISGGGTLQFEQHAAMTLAQAVSIGTGTTMVLTGNAKLSGPGSFTGGGEVLLERRDHQRRPRYRQRHRHHDQRCGHQSPHLPGHHPHRSHPARHHSPEGSRRGGPERYHHPRQPGHPHHGELHHDQRHQLLHSTGPVHQRRNRQRPR
jgi:hypothetical protein